MPLRMPDFDSPRYAYGFTKTPVGIGETQLRLIEGDFNEKKLKKYYQKLARGDLTTFDAKGVMIQLPSVVIGTIFPKPWKDMKFVTLPQYTYEIIKHVLQDLYPGGISPPILSEYMPCRIAIEPRGVEEEAWRFFGEQIQGGEHR